MCIIGGEKWGSSPQLNLFLSARDRHVAIIPNHPFEGATTVDHLGMFAKFWTPGQVKTRLATTIGDVQAAQVYRAMLSYLVDSLQTVGDRRTIAFTPTDTQSGFANLTESVAQSWHLVPQADGALGDRMTQFFESSFSQVAHHWAAGRVVLIGSDCPTITPSLCMEAFDLLRTNEVVLGPTLDGGYYLVGMAHQYRDVFSGITYSTESVLEQTVSKMQRKNLKYALLQPREDVDEFSNLAALHKTLVENPRCGQSELISEIEKALAAGRCS